MKTIISILKGALVLVICYFVMFGWVHMWFFIGEFLLDSHLLSDAEPIFFGMISPFILFLLYLVGTSYE